MDTVGSARIRYSIIDGNADGKFTINAISGLINTTGPLDREQKGKYQLKVKATDGGTPQMSSSVPVEVIVGDLNDNNPEFKGSKSFPVTENAGRGTMVGQVQVEDKDIGKYWTFFISICYMNIYIHICYRKNTLYTYKLYFYNLYIYYQNTDEGWC